MIIDRLHVTRVSKCRIVTNHDCALTVNPVTHSLTHSLTHSRSLHCSLVCADTRQAGRRRHGAAGRGDPSRGHCRPRLLPLQHKAPGGALSCLSVAKNGSYWKCGNAQGERLEREERSSLPQRGEPPPPLLFISSPFLLSFKVAIPRVSQERLGVRSARAPTPFLFPFFQSRPRTCFVSC